MVQCPDEEFGNPLEQKVIYDQTLIDPFGRLRISQAFAVFESKLIYNKDDIFWAEKLVGNASVTHLPNEASARLRVGTADGDRAVRQSFAYLSYSPGKGLFVSKTGVLGAGKTNVIRRIGYNDDNNGPYFELDGTDLYVCMRSSVTGSVVTNRIHQNDATKSTDETSTWNLDRLDGENGSGNKSSITLDSSKEQIFIIDLQWLGSGRVRFGFFFEGRIVYCHQMLHENVLETPYMASADLPVRYEIVNNGVSASESDLKQTCVSVSSEAGADLPGYEFAAGNGATLRTITERTPIIAIRLKDTFGALSENRRTIKLDKMKFFATNNPIYWELEHAHESDGLNGDWIPVEDESAVEFNINATGVATGADQHPIDCGYQEAGGQGNQPVPGTSDSDLRKGFLARHGIIAQNIDSNNSQAFVLYATPIGDTADVGMCMTWTEND